MTTWQQITIITVLVFAILSAYMHSYNMVLGKEKMYFRDCAMKLGVSACISMDPNGSVFNYTKPTETEVKAPLPSHEENPDFWDCVERGMEDYDWDEDTSMDACDPYLGQSS